MNKKLLVYFSYSGNTKIIANMIKNQVDCDILELKPKIPYSTNYQSVVDEFQNNETAQTITELESYNIDLSKYKTIIIGSPVWWYSITPAIRTFLKQNDLSKKTIIPFATNAGWLGRTFQEIKTLCPNSIIENEMNIVFQSYSDKLITTEKELENWIKTL